MPTHQGYNPVRTSTVPVATAAMDNNSVDGVSGGGSAGFRSTYSSQQLMPQDVDSVTTNSDSLVPRASQYGGLRSISAKDWFTVTVLCFVNLINYMDRFTIAGVLTDIQDNFHIGDDQGGLLQTAFVLSYMFCAPLFGYLGDRYSRRWIMAIGVFLWSATTILGSFMNHFGWFIAFRALVGVGEASYSTIAPTIISDLFISDLRSKMLAMFYFAIPVGSGLGYIVGSETARFFGSWRWALRVTPFLGIFAVILIFLIREPERGQSEGSHNLETTSYAEDIKDLVKNRSFMLSTAGFTCVAFVAGALAWWGPKFIYLGLRMQQGGENVTLSEVSFTFGAVTMISGLIGVPLGSYLSQRLVKRYPTADPLLCAGGLLISVPLMAGSMIVVSKNTVAAYFLVFLGELALNVNWAIVADILLYVVVPTRRSTAEAFQILISHAFGDAGSPYMVGVISEAIKVVLRKTANKTTDALQVVGSEWQSLALTVENSTIATTMNSTAVNLLNINDEDTNQVKFEALQYALFSTSFVEVIGGIFFLITAAYILNDKEKAANAVRDRHGPVPVNDFADIAEIS